ncbi:hypothetical protein EDC01DRAFT_781941 [Geopyxis carbonaria]|nr:hypothetical protein EDC01DRAFT_781941 [Geopyxis carbonaria]
MSFQRSALRSVLSRRTPTLASRMPARNLSQSRPLRSGSHNGNYYHKEPTSDTPWIIGSIALTVPACYYLLSSGSPKPHHADPHAKMDTASSSPGDAQPDHEGHHGALTTSDDEKPYGSDKAAAKSASSSDSGEATPEEEEGASSDDEAADKQTASGASKAVSETAEDAKDQAKETAGKLSDKASELYGSAKAKATEVKDKAKDATENATEKAKDVTKNASEKAKDVTENASEKAKDVTENASEKAKDVSEKATEKAKGAAEKVSEKASDASDAASSGDHKEESKTSKDPQKTDPGYTAAKKPKSENEMSGKQEGLSNTDTKHPLLHTERGDAISKKPEGVHQTAKLKGTVDVNR